MMALGIRASNPLSCEVAANSPFSQNVHSNKVVKNALGSRIDLAWKHGICINGVPRKNQCKFCQRFINKRGLSFEAPLCGNWKGCNCLQKCDWLNKKSWGCCGFAAKINEKTRFDVEDDDLETEKRKRAEEEDESSYRNIFKKRGSKLVDHN